MSYFSRLTSAVAVGDIKALSACYFNNLIMISAYDIMPVKAEINIVVTLPFIINLHIAFKDIVSIPFDIIQGCYTRPAYFLVRCMVANACIPAADTMLMGGEF